MTAIRPVVKSSNRMLIVLLTTTLPSNKSTARRVANYLRRHRCRLMGRIYLLVRWLSLDYDRTIHPTSLYRSQKGKRSLPKKQEMNANTPLGSEGNKLDETKKNLRDEIRYIVSRRTSWRTFVTGSFTRNILGRKLGLSYGDRLQNNITIAIARWEILIFLNVRNLTGNETLVSIVPSSPYGR
uniref:Uncharacterized protein n=1 Tax=Romanomermis culicivorax TaxID=13658 RepID=A0A915K2Y3_ROMCU